MCGYQRIQVLTSTNKIFGFIPGPAFGPQKKKTLLRDLGIYLSIMTGTFYFRLFLSFHPCNFSGTVHSSRARILASFSQHIQQHFGSFLSCKLFEGNPMECRGIGPDDHRVCSQWKLVYHPSRISCYQEF